MTKQIQRYFIIFLFTLLFLNSCSNEERSGTDYLDLSGTWKIIASDSIDYARPDYNDSQADEITIPGDWHYILERNENMAATVWLRKKINISKNFTDDQFVLFLGKIHGADKVYVNGELVGRFGKFPSNENRLDYDFDIFKKRSYIFSSKLIAFDRENVIAIKLYSHYMNGFSNNPKLYTLSGWQKGFRFRNYVPSVYNVNPFAILIVPGLLFFIVIQGNAKKIFIFHVAGLTIAYICLLFVILGMPAFLNGLYRFKLILCMYTILDFFLLLVIQGMLEIKKKWVMLFFAILLVITNALVLYSPTTQYLFLFNAHAAYILIFIYILYISYIFISAVIKDPRRYWLLVLLVVIVLLSFSQNLYVLMTHQWYKLTLGFVIRLPLIVLCGLFFYIFELKNMRKERNLLTKSLLKKTRELNLANRIAGAVDVKSPPRDAIHELIDYLDNNFHESYDRKALAEKFGLNENYLGQLFRNATGTNVASYINDKRILAAKQLLEETNSAVTDIAFHVGFDNLSYFYRLFKKHTGQAPKDYRHAAKNI